VFSLIAAMIDAMKKIVSVGEGFVVALSVEKQLVFFERGSFQKQMNHQHLCYWWAHEVWYNPCCKVAKVVSAALSLEKWLVLFERVSLQKQMSDQYT
jgi:hypothetical protein